MRRPSRFSEAGPLPIFFYDKLARNFLAAILIAAGSWPSAIPAQCARPLILHGIK
jgi:hypothetical protein